MAGNKLDGWMDGLTWPPQIAGLCITLVYWESVFSDQGFEGHATLPPTRPLTHLPPPLPVLPRSGRDKTGDEVKSGFFPLPAHSGPNVQRRVK